ncbi:MAG TPA: amino acid adenylation domain-containing protein [Polyangiaceae bacterium]|nr:amino acid adenylation domain-containing protein [Polyangiaceae bacterium]
MWSEVLKRSELGVTENFFDLGGDSILSLQIIARARESGLLLSAKQVFEQPTIAAQARVATAVNAKRAEQRPVEGEVPLTPIQARFFERHPEGTSHWNQSVLLRAKETLSVEALERTLAELVRRHDALRLRFARREGRWTQQVADVVNGPHVEVVDLRAAEDVPAALAEQGERVQRSLDIVHGPLLRAAYSRLPDGESRLLLAIHHLAVDGVSWRVLLDELEQAYAKAERALPFDLPAVTTPFSLWATRLAEYAELDDVRRESTWWQAALAGAEGSLPGLRDGGDRRYESSRDIVMRWDTSWTRRLLEAAPRAYRMRVDEVLLTALLLAIGEVTERTSVLVDLEGHGREDVLDDVDVSRTVGWFTSRYPVWLENAANPATALQRVKERLRTIPGKGLRWGLFSSEVRAALPASELSFNYLGRFDPVRDGGRFTFADEAAGVPVDPATSMSHALDVNALVRDGALSVDFRYSPDVIDERVVGRLVARFETLLHVLVEHCEASEPRWTPSDFPLAGLEPDELTALGLATADTVDVYPATPVQMGLLFHGASEAARGLYVYQLRLTFDSKLDPGRMYAAWQSVVERHDVLRTGFVWNRCGEPLQVVRRGVKVPFGVSDWSSDAGAAHEQRLAAWLAEDRERGFDVAEPCLLRIHLFQRDGGSELVWTMHHAVADGWSSALVLDEVFARYVAREDALPAARARYRDYVAWLSNRKSTESFWRGRSSRVDEPATLAAAVRAPACRGEGFGELCTKRDRAWMQRLAAAARRHRVTVATLLQGAWALLLARHADRRQAVFGVTVSGRPPELRGVEGIVGPFINSLPLWVDVPDTSLAGEWLRALQRATVELRQYEHAALSDVQRWAGQPGEPLFDSLFVVENYPVSRRSLEDLGAVRLVSSQATSRTHYPLSLTITTDEALEIVWEWDSARLDATVVARLGSHYVAILEALAAETEPALRDVRLEGSPGIVARAAHRYRSVLARIVEQAQLAPTAEALRCAGESLSYGALDAWSDEVARQLEHRGVRPGDRVGLCMTRSTALVAALLGIWKAGAAYVPLDPAYPDARLRSIAGDTAVRIIIADRTTAPRLSGLLPESDVLIAPGPCAPSGARGTVVLHPERLAYVISTSGSTGTPKGVAVGHGALAAHVDDYVSTYAVTPADRVYQFSTINFDAAAEQLFPALAAGACVVMRGEELPDGDAFDAALREERITIVDLPTSYFNEWLRHGSLAAASLRLVTVGGEELPAASVALWKRSALAAVRLDNSYGPTETAIAALFHTTSDADARADSVPIGVPYPGRTVRVLDSSGFPVAAGAVGELCIGGPGLARGYDRRPALTAERFVPDPHGSSDRLYRTGDFVRRRDDGAIAFVGRRDAQVKLRGHRVELGEVESALLRIPGVHAGAVVRRGAPESPRLVAYVVGPASKEEVSAALRSLLPSFMVPSSIVEVAALPRRVNGKVDRDALPDEGPTEERGRVAPRTELERRLSDVWRSVLGLDAIGVTDDFFELGGDSISSLRVVSRARAAGIRLTPKQLFERRTVEQLARAAEDAAVEVVAEVHEVLPLTPIQEAFFEQHPEGEAHYNQFVLLRVAAGTPVAVLDRAVRGLIARHDALRLRFVRHGGHFRQQVVDVEPAGGVIEIDLRAERDFRERLRVEGDRLHRSLNLADGPLLRAAYFHLAGGEGRLLIVVHHLAVDGVSFRILLEELEASCDPLSRGEATPSLPAIGTPWSVWSRKLHDAFTRLDLRAEVERWQRVLGPRDAGAEPDAAASFGPASETEFRLDAVATRRLVEGASRAYGAGVDVVLLTALAQSMDEDEGSLLVDVERHGREELGEGFTADLSQTVGWFTTEFPVRLDVSGDDGRALRATAERLRAAPYGGLYFGWLRHAEDAGVRAMARALPRPRVSFNYLGRFDGALKRGGVFALAHEACGAPVSAESRAAHALEVNAHVEDGVLSVRLRGTEQTALGTLAGITARYEARLRALVEHCADAPPAAAPERPLSGLTVPELAELALDSSDVEDVYPATPLQQGLLFHTALDGDGAYVNQLVTTIRGPLDVEAFRSAWSRAVERHPILRTRFEWRHGGDALQVVERRAELPFTVLDWSAARDASERLAAFRRDDLARGIDPASAPLMRVALIRRPDGAHDFVWTSHHALLDGWSTSLLLGEVLGTYDSGSPRSDAPRPYRDYVVWLAAQSSSKAWWRERLARFDDPAGWRDARGASEQGEADVTRHAQIFDEDFTRRLVERARTWGVTVPVLIQAAWAIVLSRHANRSHVAFGLTVAGRPPELDGSERMLGLFINSLPVWTAVPAASPLRAWVRELHRETAELGAHEHTPLHELTAELGRAGEPLFDSLLIFENYPADERLAAAGGELRFEQTTLEDRTHYPLTITVTPGRALALAWTWPRRERQLEIVERVARRLERVLEQIASGGERRVSDVHLDAPIPSTAPLVGYSFQPLAQRIAAQALRRPSACAVSAGAERLTYADLAAWARAVAGRLRRAGVEPEERVGLCVERSLALPPAMLGVLDAGAVYVPLDPTYPPDRLAFMLADAGVRRVVADASSAARLSDVFRGLQVISAAGPDGGEPSPEPARPHPRQLAYVMYTSGSTGTPKGVAVHHEALDRFLASAGEHLRLSTRDLWLALTSVSFDISALEIYLPLLTGATVEIAPQTALADGAALAGHLVGCGATVMQATPTTWRALVEAGWRNGAGLTALCGGEALPADLAAELLGCGLALWNMYGPTETTVWSSAARLHDASAVHLGQPLHDTVLRLLDGDAEPTPEGGEGELCIGGTNLARGYLGRPALTAERFVPDPFGPPGARLYRTGDACRLRSGGMLEFAGRLDQQVKLRGHRIELGEIEVALRRCDGVRDAVAVVRGNGARRRIVAYVTGSADRAALDASLAATLPPYMVPSVIVELAELPRTLNGKVARGALPDADGAEPFEAPRTADEAALAEVWAAVLDRRPIGVRDDFFALGGHSLDAVRLVARIARRLGRELPLASVFAHPVLADQAAELARLPRVPASIPRRPDPLAATPLSPEQERLWFLWKLDPASTAYAVSGALRLQGALDVAALRASLEMLVRRHATLRTRFVESDSGPLQRIDDAGRFGWSERTLESGAGAEAAVAQMAAEPFDLERGPIFRAALLRSGSEDHVLWLSVHHIVSDGASIDILLRELDELYRAAVDGRVPELEPLPIQYADYAAWRRRATANAAELAFWRERLGTEQSSLELPVDRARSGRRSERGGRIQREVAAAQVRAIESGLGRGASRAAILLAAFDALLHRYCDAHDVRVGVPVSGRNRLETEGLVGLFVNTVVHRAELRGSMSFAELAEHAQARLNEARAHAELPFSLLVEALGPARSLAETPLFRVTFNFEESGGAPPKLGALRVSPVVVADVAVPFDLMLDIAASEQGYETSFAFARDLFDARTIERLADDFTRILDAVARDPSIRIGAIELARPAQGALEEHPFRSIVERFAAQAARSPGAVAVRFEGTSVTYGELEAWSNRVARRLRRSGVGREERVAVCVNRSPDLVAAVLGVLKAGAAYVPLDPAYPVVRLRETLADSRVARAVVDTRTAGELGELWDGLDVVVVSDVSSESDVSLDVALLADQLAYVIYTSGSTGRPKGVGVTHRNVARLFDATRDVFSFGSDDVWTLFHSAAFDFSVWEIFGAFVHGGRLVVVPQAVSRDPARFRALLAEERVTVLNQTPSAFFSLVESAPENPLGDVRVVVFGGEKLEPARLAGWLAELGPRAPHLVNMYGITETTVHVTQRSVSDADVTPGARSLIGRPLNDLALHVLDKSGNVVPVGGVGELYVGGAGVARGYLGRPGLTAERFVPDPYAEGGRLYASGDRARKLPDDIEYLGRADHQVKIRGHRVELGEVEAVLRDHPALRDVAVVARDGGDGVEMTAYVVARADVAIEMDALRRHLAARLPSHMVPRSFVRLDALPLTVNGKLDRAALPRATPDEQQGYVPPRNDTETVLCRVYAEVLGVPRVGADGDFFALGGHSLLAIRAAARLAEELGRPVGVAALFLNPSVAALAEHLDAEAPSGEELSQMSDWLDSLT